MCILFGYTPQISVCFVLLLLYLFHKMNFIIFSCQKELIQSILFNYAVVLQLYKYLGLRIRIFFGYNPLIIFVTFFTKLDKVKIY